MENLNSVFETKDENENLPISVNPIHEQQINDKFIDTLSLDFNTAKDNIDILLSIGKQALEKILAIAEEGQHPRFYEAAALLIKNLSDANKDYLDIHEKLSRIKKNYADIQQPYEGLKFNINNAVFSGTSTDLLKQINPRRIINIDDPSHKP